jgi:hypothetical protein
MLCLEENLMQPELLDVIEVLVDYPEHHVQAGMQGTIVHCYQDNAFEVEFVNEEGETTALFPMLSAQFIVVWKASTKQWLPAEEQAADLVSHLPEEAKQEVLDFARFLHTRKQAKQKSSEEKQSTTRGETRA